MAVLIVNPLKETLAHYECELAETLARAGVEDVEFVKSVSGDGMTGARQRIAVAARAVGERLMMARRIRGQTLIVVWPLFGYLDPLMWMRLARRNIVCIIIHDPAPLRRSYGQSFVARALFKAVVDRRNILVIYHTSHAQRVGIDINGIRGIVVPHPILRRNLDDDDSPRGRTPNRPVVRVLGQYKHTRSRAALELIAEHAAGSFELEIRGRGWPEVRGWTVKDQFVPEEEFTALIASADCVVIPYDNFFQSGVAVRCMEVGVPVVAPRHEHIAQLYGDNWVGTVNDASDWFDAVVRALAIRQTDRKARLLHVAEGAQKGWKVILAERHPRTR